MPTSRPLPNGNTLASAVIVTVPVDKFCLLVVMVTVALALVVTLPMVKSTLFPVTGNQINLATNTIDVISWNPIIPGATGIWIPIDPDNP